MSSDAVSIHTSGIRQAGGLLRILGLAFGIAVVVGDTVGVGIMRTTGPTAGRLGEPWLIYTVWLGIGIFILSIVNSLAELATAIPKAGGLYVYVRRAFGDYLGFACGWASYAIQVLAVGYLATASGEFLAQIWPSMAGHEGLVATGLIVLFTGFNSLGLQVSSAAQQIVSLLKVLMLAGLVVAAFMYSGPPPQPAHTSAAAGHIAGVAGIAGMVGIIISMQMVLEVYGGFDAPCYFSEETTNPGRTVPRALFYGVLLVIVIYLAVNAALLHVMSPQELSTSNLAAGDMLARIYGAGAGKAVAVLAVVASLGVLNTSVLLAPRILYGMSRDALFFRFGTSVTRKGVPLPSLWLSAVVSVVIANTSGFDTLYAIASFLNTCGCLFCGAALFVLRRREPALTRPFRAFGYPWLPGISLVAAAVLLVAFVLGNSRPSLIALGFIVLGYPLFRYVRRRSLSAGPSSYGTGTA
jgi:APA family basic amino acid/polyamine antiporter